MDVAGGVGAAAAAVTVAPELTVDAAKGAVPVVFADAVTITVPDDERLLLSSKAARKFDMVVSWCLHFRHGTD